MRRVGSGAVVAVLLLGGVASAQPVEDGTRVTFMAGARYVPHTHFDDLALSSGDPVVSQSPIGPEGMLSFSYAPERTIEISLELGYAYDQYHLTHSTLVMQNVPLVGTLRWMPIAGRLCPYIGGGGGYMLGFVSGATSDESETHAQEFHALIGVIYELTPTIWLTLEDRYQIASGDIIPIGQIQTGGNALMLGVSFTLEPAKDIAPH